WLRNCFRTEAARMASRTVQLGSESLQLARQVSSEKLVCRPAPVLGGVALVAAHLTPNLIHGTLACAFNVLHSLAPVGLLVSGNKKPSCPAPNATAKSLSPYGDGPAVRNVYTALAAEDSGKIA
ncbi:MAG: hypothetical protein ONB30_09610, partial [candidate division KSB1 bacterium]|nr:hypothetical protein [candidate division KSB1 bacterium]